MRWRPLVADDLPRLNALAATLHPAYPERPEVFAERLALAPRCCFAFADGADMLGYALAHPWAGAPPKLDTLLAATPPRPDHLYLHDVALLPQARGRGAVAALLQALDAQAQIDGLAHLALVAVSGLSPFWRRRGFTPHPAPPGSALAAYGVGARYMTRPAPRNRAPR